STERSLVGCDGPFGCVNVIGPAPFLWSGNNRPQSWNGASSKAGEPQSALSGSSKTAPIRKQSAPKAVNELALARSRALPVEGTTYDAIAEIPKATQPRRLTAATHHSSALRGRHAAPPQTSTYAR